MNMGGPTESWQDKAKAKRESILALIPPKWRLNVPLPSAHEQLDVTGKYIQQFLSAREIEITETDATGIVGQTCIGKWKAREVTEAFCHRAAIAHQLVRVTEPTPCKKFVDNAFRPTACTRSSSKTQ